MMQKTTLAKHNQLPKNLTWWPIMLVTEEEAVKRFKEKFPGYEPDYFEVRGQFWFPMEWKREMPPDGRN
jgi:hypothetical protein